MQPSLARGGAAVDVARHAVQPDAVAVAALPAVPFVRVVDRERAGAVEVGQLLARQVGGDVVDADRRLLVALARLLDAVLAQRDVVVGDQLAAGPARWRTRRGASGANRPPARASARREAAARSAAGGPPPAAGARRAAGPALRCAARPPSRAAPSSPRCRRSAAAASGRAAGRRAPGGPGGSSGTRGSARRRASSPRRGGCPRSIRTRARACPPASARRTRSTPAEQQQGRRAAASAAFSSTICQRPSASHHHQRLAAVGLEHVGAVVLAEAHASRGRRRSWSPWATRRQPRSTWAPRCARAGSSPTRRAPRRRGS